MVFPPSRLALGGPPINNAEGPPPRPFSPWQAAHFCAYITAPCAAVPDPLGSPAPSGLTVMSQAAVSAGVIALPRLGVSAARAPAANARIAAPGMSCRIARLCIDMFHLPIAAHGPTRNRIEVLARESGDLWRPRSLTARGDKIRAQRL